MGHDLPRLPAQDQGRAVEVRRSLLRALLFAALSLTLALVARWVGKKADGPTRG